MTRRQNSLIVLLTWGTTFGIMAAFPPEGVPYLTSILLSIDFYLALVLGFFMGKFVGESPEPKSNGETP